MSEQIGEKTEQPTPRKLEEALQHGQFPKSAEIQTVVVITAVTAALAFSLQETWEQTIIVLTSILGRLHEIQVTELSLQADAITAALVLSKCAWPALIAAMIGGLLAGGIQSRFQTASEALALKWDRINPVAGLKRICSLQSTAATAFSLLKITAILALSYNEIQRILNDPIFYASVDPARIASFIGAASLKLVLRVALILGVIAALDYAYQFWKTNKDLMMTRQEVKDESKNSEGNPEVKARLRRRRNGVTKRKMLLDVPKADVVVTNPTHISVALRYDRKTMKAPRIVAKGSRLNALRIREIAKEHRVPIMENKPLARLMFKHGRVGGEIPAELYAAVAEVLAAVYRANRYKYFAEQNQVETK